MLRRLLALKRRGHHARACAIAFLAAYRPRLLERAATPVGDVAMPRHRSITASDRPYKGQGPATLTGTAMLSYLTLPNSSRNDKGSPTQIRLSAPTFFESLGCAGVPTRYAHGALERARATVECTTNEGIKITSPVNNNEIYNDLSPAGCAGKIIPNPSSPIHRLWPPPFGVSEARRTAQTKHPTRSSRPVQHTRMPIRT